MQSVLAELNQLPGVTGSMFTSGKGEVLAHAFPPQTGAAALAEVASTLADYAPALRTATGTLQVLDLRYGEARVVVRPIGDAALVLLCAKSVNVQLLLMSVTVAVKKFERLRDATRGATPAPGNTSSVSLALGPTAQQAGGAPGAAAAPAASRRRPIALVGAALALLALGGGAAAYLATRDDAGAAGQAATTPAVAGVLFRVAGADAVSSGLGTVLAQGYLASRHAADVAVVPRGEDFGVRGTLDGAARAVQITARGAGSFDALLQGTADLVISSRRIGTEEAQRLAALGSMTSPATEHVLALNGLTVVVNRANAVPSLRREQLQGLLDGRITDWSQVGLAADEQSEWASVGVGGKGGTLASGVHAYALDAQTGLPPLLQGLLLGGKPIPPEVKRFPNAQALVDAIQADPGGIGVVPMNASGVARPVPISDGDNPAVLPTPFTVAAEEYPLTHRVYLYTAQSSRNADVTRFVQYALGGDGQEEIKKAGLVELSVKAERRPTPVNAPAEYVKLTAGARRLTSTFRFEAGSSNFDNRALSDLDRVVDFLREHELSGPNVRVLGFADGQGAKAANLELSRGRATQVAQALAQRGLAGVVSAGLGAALPLADNATEAGRQRNRRVEIWIAR